MPQVEWVLRRLERPHQTLLFSATLDERRPARHRYLNDPVFHEVASSTQTVAAMEHRFLQIHQMDKVRWRRHLQCQEKSLIFVRTSVVRQARRAARARGPAAAASTATCARPTGARPCRLRLRKLPVLVATDVAARDCTSRRRRGDPLRPAEDHKAYLHRSGRRHARSGRGRGHPGAVEQVVEAEVIQRPRTAIPIVESSRTTEVGRPGRLDPAPEESVL